MKKIILYILLTISILGEETALVASFNSLHLGWKGKNYYEQAEVISYFDLVALQEVMKQDGLKRLVKELERITGEKWRYHISPYSVGTSKKYREYYGYIYREDKVKLLKSMGFYKEKNDEFSREPYGAYFKIGEFDFILVNNHSVYGDKKAERQGEAMELSNVYDYFQGLDKKEKDVIIVGDFNLPAYDEAFADLFRHKEEIFYAIDPTNLTTVGKNGLASAYDNIFYSFVNTKEYTGRNGIFDFTEFKKYIKKYDKDRYKVLRKELSDHLPVYIEVNIDKDDD